MVVAKEDSGGELDRTEAIRSKNDMAGSLINDLSIAPDPAAALICDVSVFSISMLDVSDSELAVLDASILHVANKQDISAMQQCSLRYFEIVCKYHRNQYEKQVDASDFDMPAKCI